MFKLKILSNDNKNLKNIFLYIFFLVTLFLGFILGENSSGGGKIDYDYLIPFIKNFSLNFSHGLHLFASNDGSLIHSPVFYFIFGKFHAVIPNVSTLKFLYIFISCFLPILFYQILREKYKTNSNLIFLLSLIIFISPYFRSSAIWLLGDNLSLIFFSLSVYFFNKTQLYKKNFNNFFMSILFLAFCCYIRYYYCVFAIYFFFIFYKNLSYRNYIFLILISLILLLPALYYFYYIILNYNFLDKFFSFGTFNIYSNSLIILSILLFYLIPFSFYKFDSIKKHVANNLNLISSLFIIIFFMFFIDEFINDDFIEFSSNGGGVFMKIAKTFNLKSTLLLSLASFFSLIIIDFIFKNNRANNYFLLLLLILSFPMYTIYQKYFDPLFLIFFFGLIKSEYISKIVLKKINISYTFFYFLSFYLFSLIYYQNM